MPGSKVTLKPQRIGREVDPLIVERMRLIFNANVRVLTKNAVPNTPEEQQAWWATLDHRKVIVTLYRPVDQPWDIAAFSMVTDRGDHCTPFFVTDPRYRGRGIGEQIIQHYLSIAPKRLYGEALVSNEAIHHLNAKFGWKTVGFRDDGKVELLFHPGPEEPRNFPEEPRNFPEEPRNFPEEPRNFPEEPRNFPEEPRNFPDYEGMLAYWDEGAESDSAIWRRVL